jgi:hypothetical protein
MIGRKAALAHRLSIRDIRELSQTHRYLEWLCWNPDLDRLGERDETDVAISSFQVDEMKSQTYSRLSQVAQTLGRLSQDFCGALNTSLSKEGSA